MRVWTIDEVGSPPCGLGTYRETVGVSACPLRGSLVSECGAVLWLGRKGQKYLILARAKSKGGLIWFSSRIIMQTDNAD